jgi:nucleoside-diphosphate-sugar epimerase
MDVLVAGGHGQIGRRLLRLLAEGGHTARGLIRNPDHVADLEADGAHPVLCDLETDDVRPHVGGADAIVFAAGAGPGSGAERKRTVDLGGALKCIAAAQELGVARFVIVSSMGTEDLEHAGPMRPYYEAKAEADAALSTSGLEWTIVRPGPLTDEPGTGTVDAAPALARGGEIPRDDVALVLYHCLPAENTVRASFELLSGPVPVEVAVRAIRPGTGPFETR